LVKHWFGKILIWINKNTEEKGERGAPATCAGSNRPVIAAIVLPGLAGVVLMEYLHYYSLTFI
jgi:hypothetical protein